MAYYRCKIPVAADHCRVWVIIAKDSVVYAAYPHIIFVMLPVVHRFRTGDPCAERLLTLIDDSSILGSAVDRIDIFVVDTRCNQNFISCFCNFCRIVDELERHLFCSVSILRSGIIDIVNHFSILLFVIVKPENPAKKAVTQSFTLCGAEFFTLFFCGSIEFLYDNASSAASFDANGPGSR